MTTTKENIGRAPAFNFAGDERNGQFLLEDGGLVERKTVEAVKQWFALMLRQQPDNIPIYKTDGNSKIGIDRSILRRDFPEGIVRAEIERQVRETASFCPAVRSLDSFQFERLRRGLKVSFTVRLHTNEATEVSAFVGS